MNACRNSLVSYAPQALCLMSLKALFSMNACRNSLFLFMPAVLGYPGFSSSCELLRFPSIEPSIEPGIEPAPWDALEGGASCLGSLEGLGNIKPPIVSPSRFFDAVRCFWLPFWLLWAASGLLFCCCGMLLACFSAAAGLVFFAVVGCFWVASGFCGAWEPSF